MIEPVLIWLYIYIQIYIKNISLTYHYGVVTATAMGWKFILFFSSIFGAICRFNVSKSQGLSVCMCVVCMELGFQDPNNDKCVGNLFNKKLFHIRIKFECKFWKLCIHSYPYNSYYLYYYHYHYIYEYKYNTNVICNNDSNLYLYIIILGSICKEETRNVWNVNWNCIIIIWLWGQKFS